MKLNGHPQLILRRRYESFAVRPRISIKTAPHALLHDALGTPQIIHSDTDAGNVSAALSYGIRRGTAAVRLQQEYLPARFE